MHATTCRFVVMLFLFRISADGVIKVADFGLTEDVYVRNYFRVNAKKKQVKLPIKWMALESIHDGLFSEKTDVVCNSKCHQVIKSIVFFLLSSGHLEYFVGRFSMLERLLIQE